MIIYKKYTDKNNWFKTSLEEMIERTEGSEYYKKGTALSTLLINGKIFTPFAIWSLNKTT